MPYQSSCVVLWYPCPLTLGDEPLPGGVEHCACEIGVGYAELCISFDHLVDVERWKQSALGWQGCIQQPLQLAVQRHLPLSSLRLQLSELIGLDLDEPSQVPLA